MTDEIQSSDRLQNYQRLIEISRDLASTLDLDILLNRIVHAGADLTGAQAASILLYDHANQQLYFQSASNLEKPMLQGLLVPMDSLAGWIVRNRQPVIIPDVSKDERHFGQIGKSVNFETRSLLGVPLMTKDKVIGVLESVNKIQGEFVDDDLDILSALGAQAAVAIENTRLFQQSDLISEFIHELRTPLASLNTAAYLLMRPEFSIEQRSRTIKTIYQETNRLSEMSSAFLDLARLESGRVQFQHQNFDLCPLLEESASVLRAKITEKGQSLEIVCGKKLPKVYADRNKIKQVIINLLSNATKYTPQNGKLTLQAFRKNDHVAIAVVDTGLGIPPDGLEHLFEKFYRVPGSEKMAQGTGLGLSICKKIVDGHGGRIEVDSAVGKGSTFTVYLPHKKIRGGSRPG